MLSSPDADLVRRDSAIPGLATLMEPDELARATRAERLPVDIPRARLCYVRYKPGTSYLAGYAAPGEAEPTLLYATAFRPESAKLIKAKKRKRAPWLQGGGRFVLERRATEICFFPSDDHLPALIDLLNPDTGGAFISTTFRRKEISPSVETQVLAYKPERRCTLALTSAGAPAGVLKAYTPAEFAAAHARAAALRTVGSARVQHLLSSDEASGLLLFEWLHGKSLGEQIRRGEASDSDLYATGESLARLHLVPAQLPARPSDASALEALVSGLRILCPDAAAAAGSCAARAASLVSSDDSPAVVVHGDFYATQVVMQSDGASLLDLDQAAFGSAAADLGNFIAHMELEAVRGRLSPEAVATHSESLLEGYSSRRALPPEPLLLAHSAASLLSLTHQPFRRHLPDWRLLIAAIVARAGAILDMAEALAGTPPDTRSSLRNRVRDDAMPWLADALQPEAARIALNGNVEWDGERATIPKVHAARLLRHKPGRRCVVEYDLEVEYGGSYFREIVVGKSRARGLDRPTYEKLGHFHRSGFNEDALDGIAVPTPRGKVEQFNMWLSGKACGVPATDFVLDAEGESFGRRIAAVAHKIHTSAVQSHRAHTMRDELQILSERMQQVRQRRPDLAERVGDIERACQQLGASAVTDRLVPIHRDFYGDQLLIEGPKTWILDLDLFCLGDPALDIGNFLGHVTELALRTRGDPSAGAPFESALLQRYAQLAGESIVERVKIFRTLTLARLIWVSTQLPGRAPVTEPLLELCESLLPAERPTSKVFS